MMILSTVAWPKLAIVKQSDRISVRSDATSHQRNSVEVTIALSRGHETSLEEKHLTSVVVVRSK